MRFIEWRYIFSDLGEP